MMNETQELNYAELSLQSAELKNKHSDLVAKMKVLQVELAGLNNRVRASNTHKTRLSPEDYRAICNRQTALKRKIAELEVEAAPLKAKLRDIGASSSVHHALRRVANENATAAPDGYKNMQRAIASLRDQWLAFAEDQTRINSMRVMAAQFSRELTDVLQGKEP